MESSQKMYLKEIINHILPMTSSNWFLARVSWWVKHKTGKKGHKLGCSPPHDLTCLK